MSDFNTDNWPLYRSKMRARAERIAADGLPLGAPVTVAAADGRELQAKIGDVLVEPVGGALEVWPFELFEREMELEQMATTARIQITKGVPG